MIHIDRRRPRLATVVIPLTALSMLATVTAYAAGGVGGGGGTAKPPPGRLPRS